MARDQTRFDAACEVMAYLKQIQAPHSCIHRMSTVLHGNTEGTPASRASDKGAAEKEAQPRPTDGELWDDALSDRDRYHDIADKLANAIAAHLGIDIGEHSNLNCPWLVALEALEQHHKEQPLEMVAPADAPLSHAERQVLRDAARDSVEVVHDGFDRRSWLGEGGGYGNGSIFAFGFDAVTHNNRQTEGFKP